MYYKNIIYIYIIIYLLIFVYIIKHYISPSSYQLAKDILTGHTDGRRGERELELAGAPWKPAE